MGRSICVLLAFGKVELFPRGELLAERLVWRLGPPLPIVNLSQFRRGGSVGLLEFRRS